MKKLLYILSISTLLAVCNTVSDKKPEHSIIGDWKNQSTNGGELFTFLLKFKADGSYDGIGNEKLVVSGHYRTTGDTIYFRDGICNPDYEGSYLLTYYEDSIRFDLIKDTCRIRIEGGDGFAFKKVNK